MHRDGRYGPCRSLSPPIVKQDDYRGWEGRCQVRSFDIAPLSVQRGNHEISFKDVIVRQHFEQHLTVSACHLSLT